MKIDSLSRKAISTTATVAIVVVIIIIAGVAAYFVVAGQPTSSTTTTSGGKTTTTTSGGKTTTTTTTPTGNEPQFVKDNTLVYEEAANFEYLDPQVQYYTFDNWVDNNVFETLLWWNGTNGVQPIPWLASSMEWPVNGNASQAIFNLRQGITFQDGTPFNATAVCFTLNRLLVLDGAAPTGPGTQAAWIMQQLFDTSLSTALSGSVQPYTAAWVHEVLAQNACVVDSNYQITINMMNPTSAFPFLVAGGWMGIVSPSWVISHDDPSAGTNMTQYFVDNAGNGTTSLNLPQNGAKAGTGPYYISSVNPTTYEIILKADSSYWGGPPGYAFGAIHPSITTVDIKTVADQTTRLLDLEGGKATYATVTTSALFSILNQTTYQNSGKYQVQKQFSNLLGWFGPVPFYNTFWLNFDTNVTTTPCSDTNACTNFQKFQPFADLRFRLAVSDSVNLTSYLDQNAYGLDQASNWMYPPGTAPDGTYQANAQPGWSYNLTAAENLLKSACSSPLTSFTFYNGTAAPAGTFDNSCAGKVIQLDYQAGSSLQQNLLTLAAQNLNKISLTDSLGLTFTPVPITAGSLYHLAGEHIVYTYAGGWVDDYNWAIDWTGPMYSSTSTYFGLNLWNMTQVDALVSAAAYADSHGDIAGVLGNATALAQLGNQQAWYWLWFYEQYAVFSNNWVHGWFYNAEIQPTGGDYFATMSFAPPS